MIQIQSNTFSPARLHSLEIRRYRWSNSFDANVLHNSVPLSMTAMIKYSHKKYIFHKSQISKILWLSFHDPRWMHR